MKTLLFGKDGQLGQEFIPAIQGRSELFAVGRKECDLAHPEQIQTLIRSYKPDLIINASAYTAVDQAENESTLAQLINTQAPTVMAREAGDLGAALVHYSTDYVFDGMKSGFYEETDVCNPLSVYGSTKYKGELGVVDNCLRHLIFRTSWVFSAHGSNFLNTIIKLARVKDELKVIDDQWGAPTSTSLIVATTMNILQKNGIILGDAISSSTRNQYWGLFNLVPLGETNWHSYALYVLKRAGELGLGNDFVLNPSKISRTTSKEYSQLATRPLNSRLSTHKITQFFELQLPQWREGVDLELQKLQKLNFN